METPKFDPNESDAFASFESEERTGARDGRIAYGTAAVGPDQFPYMARLIKMTSATRYSHNCGGTVISPTFILTAGKLFL